MTHTCSSKLTAIGSDNGLSSGRPKAINRTNAGILIIRILGTNFRSEIHTVSFTELHLIMSSGKLAATLSGPQCVNSNCELHVL